MKQFILNILFLSFATAYSQESCKYPDEYLPETVEDALRYLDCELPENFKEDFRKQNEDEAVAELHFGTGLYIRNNWGFWSKKKNSLVKELRSYGLRRPDDMSSIILSLLHKRLNGCPDIKNELLNYKQVNKKEKIKENLFENEIKRKYKTLLKGDTVKVPLGVTRSGDDISFSVYSNRVNYDCDDYDCVITGTVKKKTKRKGYCLAIEAVDIRFKNESDYNRNSKKNAGDVFIHEMKYFKIITE